MIKRTIFVAAQVALFGCSSSTSTTPAGTTDAGTTGGNTANFTGQIVAFADNSAVANANVSAAGVSTTTSSKGVYTLALPKATPFNVSVTDPSGAHLSLWEQEASISGDFDRGKLRFVEKATGDTLIQTLGADPSKGVVTIELDAMDGSACASVADFPAGATITVDQANAHVIYQKGGLPAADAKTVQKAENPAAVAINATPDAQLNVTVTYDKCKQVPFPVTVGNITYTGGLKPKGGSTLSVYRIFFK